jgi:DNA polymerase I
MSKLVLIDGNAAIHRAYHAMPPMRSPKGEPVSVVHGVISMLLVIIERLSPTHIAFCFDRPEQTFRQKKLETYQSHRPPMEEDLSSQFQKVYDCLTAMQIPQYSLAGFEADDMIGTIAEKVVGSILQDVGSNRSKNSHPTSYHIPPTVSEVVIVTGDRDILQLVNDKVKLYMPVKGMSEGKLYGDDEVMERLGVLPKNIVDYKALVGDPSDNYPGVPGIGPKTALTLINQYGSFHEIYKHLSEISKSTAAKLEKGKTSGELSYELATIVKDCDISFDLKEASVWDIDTPEVLKIFEEYGFKSLPERVKKLGQKLDQDMQGTLW